MIHADSHSALIHFRETADHRRAADGRGALRNAMIGAAGMLVLLAFYVAH